MFLGYSPNSSSYRVLDSNTNSIVNVKDVYFLENIPGTLDTSFYSPTFIDFISNCHNSSIEGK